MGIVFHHFTPETSLTAARICSAREVLGVGLLMLNKGRILLGKMSDGEGWRYAGGRVEEREDLIQALLRTSMNSFDVAVREVVTLGNIRGNYMRRGVITSYAARIYLATNYEVPQQFTANSQISQCKWFSLQEARSLPDLYSPTREAIKLLDATANKEKGMIRHVH